MKKFDESLGIAREDMPQIGSVLQASFLSYLDEWNVAYQTLRLPFVSSLKATQKDYDESKVEEMLARMAGGHFLGQDEGGTKSLISNDGYVMDGHHRYAAHLQADAPLNVILVDLGISDLLDKAYQFTKTLH